MSEHKEKYLNRSIGPYKRIKRNFGLTIDLKRQNGILKGAGVKNHA